MPAAMATPPSQAPSALAMLKAEWLSAAASVCASPATSIKRICKAGPIATMVPTKKTLIEMAKACGAVNITAPSTNASQTSSPEHACRDLLGDHHDVGEDSVGARVEIDHLGPTLLGQIVTVEAQVTAVALPRVTFEIEVRDELDTVGRAKHVRFVVDTAKQGSA